MNFFQQLFASAAFTLTLVGLFRVVAALLRLAKRHYITEPIAEAKSETESCRAGWLAEQRRHDDTRKLWHEKAAQQEANMERNLTQLRALEQEVEVLNRRVSDKEVWLVKQRDTIAELHAANEKMSDDFRRSEHSNRLLKYLLEKRTKEVEKLTASVEAMRRGKAEQETVIASLREENARLRNKKK